MAFSNPRFPASEEVGLNGNLTWSYDDRRTLQKMSPGVFVGPLAMTRQHEKLEEHNITVLVAVTNSTTRHMFKPRFPDKYRYETIHLDDGALFSALSLARPLIDSYLQAGRNILLYDQTGNEQVGVVICGYLMEQQSVGFAEAYAQVRSKRLSITVSCNEQYQLEQFSVWRAARNNVVNHVYSGHELNRLSQRRKYDDEDHSLDVPYHLQAGRRHSPFAVD